MHVMQKVVIYALEGYKHHEVGETNVDRPILCGTRQWNMDSILSNEVTKFIDWRYLNAQLQLARNNEPKEF